MGNVECECATARQRSFKSVEDAVYGQLARKITDGCDLLVQSPKWMSIYRCRACGAHWVEAYAFAGHANVDHLYPLPAGVTDLQRWLEERGEPLPLYASSR